MSSPNFLCFMRQRVWRQLRLIVPSVFGPAFMAAAGSITLTAPLEHQVTQRVSKVSGPLIIRGQLVDVPAENTVIEARLRAVGAAEAESAEGAASAVKAGKAVGAGPDDWRQLVVERHEGGGFSTGLEMAAGDWQRLEVRVLVADRVVAEAAVAPVGCGEVFVIAGQSNSANHGEERQRPESGLVTTFDGVRWRVADDPQPGASGDGGSFIPTFGDAMARKFNVPIGIASCGVGATSVREWLPAGARFPHPPTIEGHVRPVPEGGWESKGDIFAAFTGRLAALGSRGFRAVLWHQGESDANQADPQRTLPGDMYRSLLGRLIRDSRQVAGWEVPWFVAQVSYHVPGDEASPDIRAAQASLWADGLAEPGPDSDALKSEWREAGGQGVHFSGPGLRQHGAQWAEKVTPWLEARLARPATADQKHAPRPPRIFSKVLILGNSITLHAPAPEIGWTGHWGMAASSAEHDYVHLLTRQLAAAAPQPPEIRVRNIAEFERGYATYDPSSAMADDLAFGAGLVILAIGENIPEPTTEAEQADLAAAVGRLLRELQRHGQPTVIVRSSFWPHAIKDGILREASRKAGATFVDIAALGRDEANAARSERVIDHPGVAAHPGDRGMQALARALFEAIP
jgi:HAMP domain-containing protein